MRALSPSVHPSGVWSEATSAAWRAIALTRAAWELADASPTQAAELWLEASEQMEAAALATPMPSMSASYLRAAASLALHAGRTGRAAALDGSARDAAVVASMTVAQQG